jgi:hypothetical protein
MTLSTLAILIGAVYSAIQLWALAQPDTFTRFARAFARADGIGFLLMAIGTAWFLYNLQAEAIADFADYKKYMLLGFAAIGILTCIFVRDFLAVRGLAICLLLLAWFTLNRTRWEMSPARLLLVVWAYAWVICGMWFTVSPWRLRDFLSWWTATSGRLRAGSFLQLALGLAVLALGFTAIRQ